MCSHCTDGRCMASPAAFARCRLSVSFLVYSLSHYSLQTRYHARAVKGRAAFILARTDQRLGGGQVHEHCKGLGHQELTGRGLGITMHQHYGYRVHFELGGEFGSRSFERRFSGYQSCKHFCISVIRGYPEGLCECMWCGKGFPSMPPDLTRGGTRRYALPRRLCIKRWSPVFTDGRPGR